MGKRRYRDLDEDDRLRARRRRDGDSRAPVIIAVVCLLVALLGGGGVLGYWMLSVRPKEKLRIKKEEAQKQEAKKRKRLVGKWRGLAKENPRTVAGFDFRADGTFRITGIMAGVPVGVHVDGTWSVVEDTGNTVRVHTVRGGKPDNDMVFEFVSDTRFQFSYEGQMRSFDRFR
jgi:hypothetical protein